MKTIEFIIFFPLFLLFFILIWHPNKWKYFHYPFSFILNVFISLFTHSKHIIRPKEVKCGKSHLNGGLGACTVGSCISSGRCGSQTFQLHVLCSLFRHCPCNFLWVHVHVLKKLSQTRNIFIYIIYKIEVKEKFAFKYSQ